jgi:hypothetical protein
MHKSATKCNETIGKWGKNKHGASKIIDTFETYQAPASSPEQIEPLGLDPQWRSSGAMSAMGGDADESQRSEGGAHRAEAEAPESGGGSRRSSPELGKGRVGDANRQRR